MSKFYRVYSDSFTGHVFTEAAYNIVKTQIGSGDPRFHESKEISSVEIDPTEKIHDIDDLASLGYTTKVDDDTFEELTEQSDDEFFNSSLDEEMNWGYDDEDDY
jgi:hypothetical protein